MPGREQTPASFYGPTAPEDEIFLGNDGHAPAIRAMTWQEGTEFLS